MTSLTPAPQKKGGSGCGCFLLGCFFGMISLVGLTVGAGYLIVKNVGTATNIGLEYVYPNFIQPKFEVIIDNGPPEKVKTLKRIDQNIKTYLNLSQSDRKKVRQKIAEIFKKQGKIPINPEIFTLEIEAYLNELSQGNP